MTSWPGMKNPALASIPRSTQSGGTLATFGPAYKSLGAVAFGLQTHAPFTLLGTLSGICIMAVFVEAKCPARFPSAFSGPLHPLHVFLALW